MNDFNILVIDDEPNNFESIEVLLTNEEYNLYYSSNGKEALASLHAFQPDLILLDLMMPEMDGLEVCKQLKLMRQWRTVPIIMLTATSGEKAIEDCLLAGADDFINKPVRGTELRARIKSMLRIKKQFDRIESFTKLQQNKIVSLEQNLVKLGADLAVGFANELYDPLKNIIDRFSDLSQKIYSAAQLELIELVNSGQRSALELERLTNKFLIYMELALEKKISSSNEVSDIKDITENIVEFRLQNDNQENEFRVYLQPAKIAVDTKHCEWIVKELLDDIIQFSAPGKSIEISGWIAENIFHFLVSNSHNPERTIQITKEDNLLLNLKTVKKIVDNYCGKFSFYAPDPQERTVYITLPLACY